MTEPLTVRCTACNGDRADEYGDECATCRGTGVVPACRTCRTLPVDPMFAPCCSGTCREAWQRAQPTPIIVRAP